MKANQAQFQVPAKRTVAMVIVDADKLGESLPITDAMVKRLGINIARIVDGKLVEEWNTWEQTKATERLKPAVLNT